MILSNSELSSKDYKDFNETRKDYIRVLPDGTIIEVRFGHYNVVKVYSVKEKFEKE